MKKALELTYSKWLARGKKGTVLLNEESIRINIL